MQMARMTHMNSSCLQVWRLFRGVEKRSESVMKPHTTEMFDESMHGGINENEWMEIFIAAVN